jgi:hypothetical protein
MERGRVLFALGPFIAFGISIGAILGSFRGKWFWAWTTALGAWGVLLFAVTLTLVVRYLMKRKGVVYHKRY